MWSISWNPAKILMCPDATCGIGRHGFVRYYGTFGRRSIKKPKHVVFFPLSGVEACKYAVFGNRFRLIFQQLPREFRDCWDLVHLSIAFVGTCVTALLYYDMLPFHSGNMIRLQRFLGPPPPGTSQTSHPATMDKSTYINSWLYLLRHLLPRCACQGWAVIWLSPAGSQPDSTGWMNTHRIHGNGIFTYMKTIKINPENQPMGYEYQGWHQRWMDMNGSKPKWPEPLHHLMMHLHCPCLCNFVLCSSISKIQNNTVYDFKSKCIYIKHTFIQRFMVEYLQTN